ncbi:MAG: Tetratricopeptide 2 repeat protein [Planctomycetaceae bacterium]|nr:Tetratricopeptide 2 repeat protein [Planctomycetaceae bacterium]
MFRRFSLIALSCIAVQCLALAGSTALAQQPAAAAPALTEDAVSAQAAKLEADLSKLRDTSPEAAELMLKLTDLYHQHGRVFGLLRIGQKFVAAHAVHPQHRVVMLKLIDGMLASARNKEVVATCRQFLQRYADDKECPQVEIKLAQTLDQTDDYAGAAEAHAIVFKRQPTTLIGRTAGVRAVQIYAALNSAEGFKQAAALAEILTDRFTNPEGVTSCLSTAVYNWERAGEWAKANLAANKLLQRNLPSDPKALQDLHRRIADNFGRLSQHANAVEALKKCRALGDRVELLQSLIMQSYYAGLKTPEMEQLVTELFQKYPENKDRFYYRALLGTVALRDGDKPKAISLYREILPFDAVSQNAAQAFVREFAVDPAKYAECEAVLRDAISKNPRDAYYLRYALGIDLFRDRSKEEAKARQVLRELIAQSPSNDGHTSGAISFLLYTAPNDAEFQADVALILKVRKERGHWGALRTYMASWINEARQNAMHKARAQVAKTALDQADQDPFIKDWIVIETGNMQQGQAARTRLLEPENAKQLSDEQLRLVMFYLAYYHRHYGNQQQRIDAATIFGRLTQKFPKDVEAATAYLAAATDYSPKEVQKEATLHMLKQETVANDYDSWYRMARAIEANADPELGKQLVAFLLKSQQKNGVEVYYSYVIGDGLERMGLKAEARELWTRAVTLNTNPAETRQCTERLVTRLEKPEEKRAFLLERLKKIDDYHGWYSMTLAGLEFQAKNLDAWEKILLASRDLQRERPFLSWGMEDAPLHAFVEVYRTTKDLPEADRRRVFTTIRDLGINRPSGTAYAALLELPSPAGTKEMDRLLEYQRVTQLVWNDSHDWDLLMPYAQGALGRKDFAAASTLLTAMLSNIPNLDPSRKKTGQDMVGQSYARMGGTGLAIDEDSPIAPLMQAALLLRLGDDRLAFDSYLNNKALFDKHRNELPFDLIVFVCENHLAAGGDENFDRVEDILRNWLVKNSEVAEIDDSTKAKVQLLLSKNYFRAQRYDVARSEYTTVINRYSKTPEAIEAEFGIGETFMAQKVYDQAEAVFEKLASSRDRDVVVRAEFLRGVLANRRGDLDEARKIFRAVLDRVPSIELANEALYNLSEVYGAEQRYMDQLELLRTVGRLGRSSKRTHTPGTALSIVVQDSDLGTSQGRTKIPVRITTEPGGDQETVYLLSSSGSKGLFRVDVETRLGQAVKNDRTLQLTGLDTIRCDYPDEFKAQFKNVPLSDAEIRVASDAKFEISSKMIVDETKETISQTLEREARDKEENRRASQSRPPDQLKPGNPIYLRVIDPDRDVGEQPDKITVKLEAASGDQVKANLTETGPHTGIFEGTAVTGELPAGALATDTAIEHSPLMAIDKSPDTFWLSQPDGAAPKSIAVDMKDLKQVSKVNISTPNPSQQAPVRGELQGSEDGRMWFRIASNPPEPQQDSVNGDFGVMKARVYAGNYTPFSTWKQIVDLTKNTKPVTEEAVEQLAWSLPADHEDTAKPFTVIWQGKFVQPRGGAARFAVNAITTAIMVDGRVELPVGAGNRTVDVWLDRGTHDLTIFAATGAAQQGATALRARADNNVADIIPSPFRKSDFDLAQPEAKPGLPRGASKVAVADNVWSFQFDPLELRHVRFVIHEYLGEAVAINNIEVSHEDEKYIPTQADILSLANNDILEIAGGDKINATYTDEFTQNVAGRSQLLTKSLVATYYNATLQPIAYDFRRDPNNGQVVNIVKQLVRIDPGERFIVQIVDYDLDTTLGSDQLKFKVAVNDGEPVELTATEVPETPGVFTKEVDTTTMAAKDKFLVKPGDRVYCTYLDTQNTFPGHAVPRETVVYVNQPSEADIRVLETRITRQPEETRAPPQITYLEPANPKIPSRVAFEAPLTIEVIDRDAAKDSRSSILVQLTTSTGSKIEVNCVVSEQFSRFQGAPDGLRWAMEEGRFIGQVILQLGGKESADIVPLSAGMPRDLVGGGKLPDQDEKSPRVGETLVTRVLNLSGKDLVTATYADKLRPKAPAKDKLATARLIANGELACLDREYAHPVNQLHVGEKLFLSVTDADLDVSDNRDVAKVLITTERGEKETITLEENLAHSGVFTGSVMLKPAETPKPGNITADEPAIETYFGDTLNIKYIDLAASTETGKLEAILQVPVVIGTDGLVSAFSKTFNDENLAVETKFHVSESYFELFKSHKKLGRADEQRGDLEAGRRVLREVMEDYPNPKYVPRIAYLLGQFAQELQQWNEAIDSYTLIVRQYPESTLAPDAQFKLAQCYEESGRFDEALEAYVTLAATYPKSPLIANVMIRISDHFFKGEKFDIAANVGEKFLEKFESHEYASRIAFRIGQCYYKAKDYKRAGDSFDRFGKLFPDDALASLALFWSGESYRMGGSNSMAFRRYNRCRWDHPASEAAKYSRGRLALPEMLQQFESEANAVEDDK